MSFITDKQTLDDLGIFSRDRNLSVYAVYNNTHTRGGARILEEMFMNPLDNCELIRRRSALIDRFRKDGMKFPFRPAWFDAAEFYLSDTDERSRLAAGDPSIGRKMKKLLKADTEFERIHGGIISLIEIVNALDSFTASLAADENMLRMSPELPKVREILRSETMKPLIGAKGTSKLTLEEAAEFDNLLRYEHRDDILTLLDYAFHADVYICAANVAEERGFAMAEVLPAEENTMEIKGAFHPVLKNPVANDLCVSSRNNIIFLTGANMAGKSTFMKTFGIAVFLAHVGFPVPAESMRFSVRDGLFTTINLPDNLNRGYSHFYAEVRRLKRVAQTVRMHPRMVVVFDELFRGTNVKDAFDATVAVTAAFSEMKQSIFVISTHIVEAGEELSRLCDNVEYLYLPTLMDGNKPVYTYKLTEGITSDRHGMLIIRNEGILDILKTN